MYVTIQQTCKSYEKRGRKVRGKFLWLDNMDERKYMTDREILDKYVDLDNSCLTKAEKD